jgi:glycosyltransferase involved in cell wall biosynthesis
MGAWGAMKIVYMVPDVDKKGGIQEFAKAVYARLPMEKEIVNWEDFLTLPEKVLLRFLPSSIASKYYDISVVGKFNKKYETISGYPFIHFWHPECAMAYLSNDYVVSCHGMEILPSNMKEWRKKRYTRVFEKAKLIHTNSEFTKTLLLNEFKSIDEHKIRVINPPVDQQETEKVKKSKPIIGTLTRFNKRKNVPNVIRGLTILRNKYHVDFEYYIAGDGKEKQRIMDELKTVQFSWKYFGEISDEQKNNEFYPFLDVFVMPPLQLADDIEGFGIVYLEANSYGIPVVASNTGGIGDAVREGVSGVFADPTNPEDIAEKIFYVLENKSKFIESTKEWARRFEPNKIASKFTEMYREVEE